VFTFYICAGKFKGYGVENQQLSLDALVDLLSSVDHDKVVTSKDAVISDEALGALLDRSFCSKKPQDQEKENQTSKHSEVFKVLEVRDEKGNVIHNLDTESESQPTNDTSTQCTSTSIESSECPSAKDITTRNVESTSTNKQVSPPPSMSTESTDKVSSAESTSITSPKSTDRLSTSRVEPMDNPTLQTTHHASSESSSSVCSESTSTGGESTVNPTPAECADNALPNLDCPLTNNIARDCTAEIPTGCTDSVMPPASTEDPTGCTDSVMPPASTEDTIPTGSTGSVVPVIPPASTDCPDSVMPPASTDTGSTGSVVPPASTDCPDSVMPPASVPVGSTAIGDAIPEEYAGSTVSHPTNTGSELQLVPAGCVNSAEYQSSCNISPPAEPANTTASSQVICY